MRIDPKAPADSPHHPRNVAFAGLQERLNLITAKVTADLGIELPPGTQVVFDIGALDGVTEVEVSPTLREQVAAGLLAAITADGQEIEAAVGTEAANSFPADGEPLTPQPVHVEFELEDGTPVEGFLDGNAAPLDLSGGTANPDVTAALEAALSEAGLVEPEKPGRRPAPSRKPASRTAAQRKATPKAKKAQVSQADLDAALAKLDKK